MTHSSQFPAALVALAWCLASGPAAALDVQEFEALKLYGGTYSTQCGNAAAPRVRVIETPMVEFGNKRMTGQNLMAAFSYLGPQPPPGHQVALLSEVRRDAHLIVLITRDKNGLYAELMGEDPAVEAALIAVLGKAQYKAKYRDCEAAGRASVSQPAQAEPVDQDAIANWDYVRDKTFKARYLKALGPKAKTA